MKIDILLTGHGHIISGSDNVLKELTSALKTVERFLATPKIYVFGMHKPQLKVWIRKNDMNN